MKRLLVASLLGALLSLAAPMATPASSADSLNSYHGDGYGGGGGGSGSSAPPGTVVIRDRAFNPNNVDVRVGEAVVWKWEDGDVAHTVTADDRSFDSGEKKMGSEFRHAFDRPGTYSYHCENHSEMKGTVKVGG